MLTPELILNLLWFAIAIWSFTAVLRNERRRVRASAMLAVICFVALLFPIISITDDIHCDSQLAEETSATRRVSAAPAAVLTNLVSAARLIPRLSLLFVLTSADE